MTIYDGLIWGGAVLTLIGLGALIWCIFTVSRARSKGLEDAQLRALMQRAVAVNMAALAASTIGLMLVVVGIFLAP
ncbi:hypothetical protein [Paracoccus fistulariae]|uniref:Uncharacterized protein n=1 Tax=Paracoccus fistulariae TaxID=658446 RepID=A0ABY7SJE4_9RHOB|nr:hypothetical protein [Paracoccus fistulariae]MDB6180639.1 hypothetical protein [Paracoccus fistulariae]WCR07126.1 hypothetical protein JHX87_16975 [Paracoccus fistulariae]